MDPWAKGKRPWPQSYDTENLLTHADLSDGSPFVVEVGGHPGIDILRKSTRTFLPGLSFFKTCRTLSPR